MITVIDYGAGNLRSVENALTHLQVPYRITSQAADVSSAAAILLPGVGHFGQMMRSLQLLGLVPILQQMLRNGTPYLGICLGMHALFERSEEAPSLPGLGILRGSIQRFPEGMKVPHMGWNQLQIAPDSRLFSGISADPFVYFAHSYYLPWEEGSSHSVAQADYGGRFVAAVESANIYGTQFHPEKSSDHGLQILANFSELTRKAGTGAGESGKDAG